MKLEERVDQILEVEVTPEFAMKNLKDRVAWMNRMVDRLDLSKVGTKENNRFFSVLKDFKERAKQMVTLCERIQKTAKLVKKK